MSTSEETESAKEPEESTVISTTEDVVDKSTTEEVVDKPPKAEVVLNVVLMMAIMTTTRGKKNE